MATTASSVGQVYQQWWPACLALGAMSSPTFELVPPAFAPLAAVPVELGLAWLGYALWSERRGQASQPVPATERALLSPAGAA